MEIFKIKARETITDQFNNIRIIEGNEYEYITESEDKYFITDELEETMGLSKEYFYPIEEDYL